MFMMVYYAYYTRKQFYPTVLFLVSSKFSFVIACNLAIAIALVVARCVKTLYFGSLREAEVEILIERAKYAIVETALALTIFRSEITTITIALFGALIMFKLLHKLSKCRLEYFEQVTPLSTFTQVRMGCLLGSLLLVDGLGIAFAVTNIMQKGKSVLILFGFEFGLLLVYAFNLKVKFLIQLMDNWMTNGLQSRGLFIMVVDLVCDVIKVITYIAFFCLVFMYYGIPFHLIRDLWATCFSLQRRFVGFIKYLQLTKNLDSRFPDATPEEIAHAGNCLVCREDMDRSKKLPCGHVFHLDCLRSWLQHQQTCPLCRSDIPTTPTPTPAEQAPPAPAPAPGPGDGVAMAANQPHPVQPLQPVEEEQAQFQHHDAPPPAMAATASRADSADFSSSAGPPSTLHVVLADNEVFVHQDPSSTSRILRMLKKGALVMVSLRVQTEGAQWLKIADGWIAEESTKVNGRRLNVAPLLKSQHSVDSNPAAIDEVPSSSGDFYSRKHFLARYNAGSSPPVEKGPDIPIEKQPGSPAHNVSSAFENECASDGGKRLDQILALQAHLRKLTHQMTQMNEAVLQCQSQLVRLSRGE